MSVRLNVHMSKIMRRLIKVSVRTYVRDVRQLSNPAYSECRYLNGIRTFPPWTTAPMKFPHRFLPPRQLPLTNCHPPQDNYT